MKSLKGISILNALHLPWFAGTEKSYLNYTKMLSNLGARIICMLPKDSLVMSELSTIPNVTIIEEAALKLNRGKFNPFLLFKLRKIIKQNNVKLIFAHSGGLVKLFNYAAYGICPIIGLDHGTNLKQIAKADYAFVATNKSKDTLKLQGCDPDNIFVIPNAIENVKMPIINKLENKVFTVGFLGRLSTEKGVSFLLEAQSFLKLRDVVINLLIAGDGDQMPTLKAQAEGLGISQNVKFLGWLDHNQITPMFFSKIDAFCLPSLAESFGLVLLEAMLHEVPIIATNADGPLEIITHQQNGMLCQKGDCDSLSKQIEHMINNQALRLELVANAKESINNLYALSAVTKKLGKAVLQITGGIAK